MWNVHRESRNIRNWFRYETFLSLRFFDIRKERHTNFFLCWLFHLTPPRAAHFVDPNWSRLGETKKRLPSSRLESQPTRSEFKSQLTAFFSNPKILSSSLSGMTSFTSPVLFPIWDFYCDICDCHIRPARAWTPALNVCT